MKGNTPLECLSPSRRNFLQQAAFLGITPLMLTVPFAGKATASSIGTTVINVRNKGAKGDGVHDDTSAIQAAIDALPARGGTVTIPSGTYMIDASRAINLRSNMLLSLAPDAELKAIPNNLPRSHVIRVWRVNNVRIAGGRIVGERNGHLGTTGEWGYGLNIESSNNVSISNMHISDCWGDGIWVGALGPDGHAIPATNVTIDRVVSTNNRRQGMSIGPVDGVTVTNSTFSNTHGTKPEAGIDIEPQAQGVARNITISHCTITGNHGSGLESHDNVVGVVIKNCAIQGNSGYGVLSVGPQQITISGNTITGNGLIGVTIAGKTQHAQIIENQLTGNSARYMRRLATALTSAKKQSTELRIDASTSDIKSSGNIFSQ